MPRSKVTAGVVIAVLFVALLLGALWATRGGSASPQPTSTSTSTKAATKAPTTSKPTGRATTGQATQKGGTDPASGLPWIAEAALPAQAHDTLKAIDAGGPHAYPGKDDVTYRNLNGVLPKKESGYYKEYTVKTPGSSDRGARRIVVGRGGEFYWTDDHYDSFARIQR